MSNLPNTRPVKVRRPAFTNKRWLVAAALLGALIGLWISPGRGVAAQPYGGCAEAWQAPHSKAAASCRSTGWQINIHGHRYGSPKGAVVSPHAVIRYLNLPNCKFEDGGANQPCAWNLQGIQGNGIGLDYWIDREDRTHYVWAHPARHGWKPVSRALAESLAEAGYDHARWERWRYDSKHVDGVLHLHSPAGQNRVIR